MDFFVERILTGLKNGKPKDFATLFNEVGFSHSTLQHYLDRLIAKGLVYREKPASNSSEDQSSHITSVPEP
jgi:predicted transcriptional regulator